MGIAAEKCITPRSVVTVSSLPIVLVPHPHVRVDKNVLEGSPYVVGSKIPVRRLFSLYRSGTSVEKLFKRYPQLSPAKILDALAFALDNPEIMESDLLRDGRLELVREVRRPKPLPGLKQVEFSFTNAPSEGDEPV